MTARYDNFARNAEIVRRRRRGEFPADIARAMGITRNAIIGVCHRAGVHLHDARSAQLAGLPFRSSVRLTPEAVRELRRLYKPYSRTASVRVLAARFGISADAARKAIVGETWGHVE